MGFSYRWVGRRLFLAGFLLLPLLAGCQQGYPEELTYPIRTDLLVDKAPSNEVNELDGPGELDSNLRQLAESARDRDRPGTFKEGAGVFYDPATLTAQERRDLDKALTPIFGTPAAPRVALPSSHPEAGQVASALAILRLDQGPLVDGSKLYRRHCLQCHGVTGDGRGPTGAWLNPHPRDFRLGSFKFISTRLLGRPSREDLFHILHAGAEGTAMPAFNTLSKDELNNLVSYIIHLSLRGEVEYKTMLALLKKQTGGPARLLQIDGSEDGTLASHVLYMTGFLLTGRDSWYAANKMENRFEPHPPEYASETDRENAVRRGYEAFLTKKQAIGGCVECHKDFGRQVAFRYDAWGTLVRPNNLTAGVYRGGRRPLDIYYRLRAGISPSTMTALSAKDTPEDESKVWDLVNFVHALPYPAMLPGDVREKVYGAQPVVGK